MAEKLFPQGNLTTAHVVESVKMWGCPQYIYDGPIIVQKCRAVSSMPNAFGLRPRYAMKANSNRAILQLIVSQGFSIDASSMNEVRRAHMAGIDYAKIMLTTQEVPARDDREELEHMISSGMKYNVCSLRQLGLISPFAKSSNVKLAMRVHPGTGSGESATRNTGDKYSCFGVHLSDLPEALDSIRKDGIIIDLVHVHIGSGGDPAKWRENIDRELKFVEDYFPNAAIVNFGGGLKEARMPNDTPANLEELGQYARTKIEEFYKKTGRKLVMEVEPGTMIVANSGYTITEVIDIKHTGKDGFEFIVLNAGMEANARQLFYGSLHPIYVVSREGKLLSSEFDLSRLDPEKDLRVPVGRCCESGDAQRLDSAGHIIPVLMAQPRIGDYVLIGGSGAYCSSMAPFNYNSHDQIPEVLLTQHGNIKLIREKQSLDQIVQNERTL
ncbi:MAG: diaminopimelate decarboxylase [Candidatus Woesearchaeota archaeon]